MGDSQDERPCKYAMTHTVSRSGWVFILNTHITGVFAPLTNRENYRQSIQINFFKLVIALTKTFVTSNIHLQSPKHSMETGYLHSQNYHLPAMSSPLRLRGFINNNEKHFSDVRNAFLKGEQVAAIQQRNIFEGHNNKVGERE